MMLQQLFSVEMLIMYAGIAVAGFLVGCLIGRMIRR